MTNKTNKKLLVTIACFFILAILMLVTYNIFKFLNNQLMNDFLIGELNLLPNSEEALKFEKAMLYYDLGMASKYIGFGSLGITVILSCVMGYKSYKTKKN